MKTFIAAVVALLTATAAYSHEWTPSYPQFKPSFMEGIAVTTMTIFNRRKDISYYEVSVLDEDWNPVPFASTRKLINVEYLEKQNVDIYLREVDCDRVEYICTTSKILERDATSSGVDSRICSRV